jgi:hypothetical protein
MKLDRYKQKKLYEPPENLNFKYTPSEIKITNRYYVKRTNSL